MSLPPMQTSAEIRARLQHQQRQLLDALRGHQVPKGFDAAAVHRCGQSLVRKRRREAARALPGHAKWLEPLWTAQFAAYAAACAAPGRGGPLADALGFLRWIQALAPLPATQRPRNVRVESVFVNLRWRVTPEGAVPRSGLRLAWAFFGEHPRLLLAVRFASRRRIVERHWWC